MTIHRPNEWAPCDHFLLHVGSWFDGEQLHVEPAVLEIRNGKIVRIGTPADLPGANLPVLDAADLSASPTLCDAHIHSYLSAWPIAPAQRKTPGQEDVETEIAAGMQRLEELRHAGVGAVRDMGDPKLYNNAIRARLHAARDPLTFQSGGQGLFMPGRYGRFLGIAADPADLEKEVDRLATVEKVDFIKLIPTGIINFAKGTVSAPPSYSVAEITAVVARARHHGLKVAAHCSGVAGLNRCIKGGVDFIEHAYFGTREHMEQMCAAGLCWTPTIIPVHVQWEHAGECGWDEQVRTQLRKILDEHNERLRIAREIGLAVLTGSDAGGGGVGHGGGVIQEIMLIAQVYPAIEALGIATAKTHAAIGVTDQGRLAVGQRAKLVLYAASPATDLDQLRRPQWILQDRALIAGREPRCSDAPDALQFDLTATTAATADADTGAS